MKLSLSWAQYYSNVDLKAVGKDKLVEKIGAQLGAVEEVKEWGPLYKNIVVAKVVDCIKHPDADKLSICRIDDGKAVKSVKRDDEGFVQVVCGAPNVASGMYVAWIPPGAVVPSTADKDPLTLEARKIRGEMSNGMIASPSELAISDDHSGILEISPKEIGREPKPGERFVDYYGLDDTVINIENKMFTHRPDCFGILGLARELAGIQGLAFKSPDWYLNKPDFSGGSELPLQVKVESPELVSRFMAIAVKEVHVRRSPYYMQAALTRVGIKPINNIVDITNFMMYLTGQPLHAYDYDKVKAKSITGPVLVARQAKKNESIALLNGKTVSFDKPAVLIATDNEAVGVGGVMGGRDTEVGNDTKNIILECATFDMFNIRRTAMKYGLFTEAVTRFTKGQSPLQNDRVLAYALQTVVELSGGVQASEVQDVHGALKNPGKVISESKYISDRLGIELNAEEMSKLLRNTEFEVSANGEKFEVIPPFWRTDIEIKEDVVEEVGRLYGFDHLPLELPKRSLKPASLDGMLGLKAHLRTRLAAYGANEVLSYSFIHGGLTEKAGQDKNHAYQISNAISPDLQYYRLSLTPSLLEKVHPNIKAGHESFVLFEINKVHSKLLKDKEGLPIELNHLAFVLAAENKDSKRKLAGAPYYYAKLYLDTLLKDFNLSEKLQLRPLGEVKFENDYTKQLVALYEPKRSAAIVDGKDRLWGVVGEYKSSVRRELKLPKCTVGAEVNINLFLEGSETGYRPRSRFPKVEQDISLRLPADTVYAELFEFIKQELGKVVPANTWHNLEPVDIYQKETETESKQVTLRLTIASFERTLTAGEVNIILDEAADAAKKKYGAVRL